MKRRGDHGRNVSIVGLGYVGLPVAVAFGATGPTIGFDIDRRRIEELKAGHDRRGEVTAKELADADLHLTSDPRDLGRADFHIVAVPTPVDTARRPDLRPLLSAARTVGAELRSGGVVVFESTVYPGVTEDECVPVLEAASGLRCGEGFKVGYSPERINPGDPNHSFTKIKKVVSGQDAATLELVARVYRSVVEAGVFEARSIKAAEAAKVIENTQRDLNIALMNELSILFQRIGIDTQDVLEAAGTKWNFLRFSPGLVGGHCIGVDPYYLTYKAQQLDYHPEVILAGRRINDGMGRHVATEVIRCLMRRTGGSLAGRAEGGSVATILGATFKEDVRDVRNSRVHDIVRELAAFGMRVQLHDPVADAAEVEAEFGVVPRSLDGLAPADAVILAVPHAEYRRKGWPFIQSLLRDRRGVVADVKACLDRDATPEGVVLWRL